MHRERRETRIATGLVIDARERALRVDRERGHAAPVAVVLVAYVEMLARRIERKTRRLGTGRDRTTERLERARGRVEIVGQHRIGSKAADVDHELAAGRRRAAGLTGGAASDRGGAGH